VTTQQGRTERADWSEQLAITLAGQGAASTQAFEAIYAELAPAVASYLRMSAVPDVEGLTNEVFLQVHRGLARFKGDWPAFRSWVFTIAHHRMVDETRRAMRRPQAVPLDDVLDRDGGDVEQDALTQLSDAWLRSLLDELSDDQRAVLLLRIAADLPLERVAVVLGKSVGAVKALQHRALANLRRSLTRQEADA
jgi:RNA polymerase sigma-70 factor (ECF subfamily)